MRAIYVPPVRTPIPFEQALACMRWALKCQLGYEPPDEVVALALAKTALETARWTQIWLYNFGNVKAGPDYVGWYTCILLNEVLRRGGRDVVVWFSPEGELTAAPSRGGKLVGPPIPVPEGHPQTRMRAHVNKYDGASCYVDFVAGGRYREAWSHLLRGDAAAYVHALKLQGYFTADESVYAKGVISLQREMLARIRAEAPPPAVDLEWARLKILVPQLQFDASELLETTTGNDFAEAVA